jgi:predicted MFS family arabinose efflux permease
MFSSTISLYKNAYSGLTPSTWLLSVVMLINRSGTMVLPFMTIYLTSPEMGYSIGKAGIVMAFFGLGAVAGGYFGGKLTDRIGYYPVQLMTLIGGGILFMVLGQMKSFPLICLFTFILTLVNEAFRPANSTAIVAYSSEENRTRSYAVNRLAVNLGWAVGSAVGGILAHIDYELLFWVDGCTNIGAALLLWYFLRPSKKPAVAAKKEVVIDRAHSAYRDKAYLWFICLTILFAMCFFQVFINLPVYFRNELHFSEPLIGFINAINGVLIALIELVLIFKLEGRRSTTYYIIRGVALVGIAYLMLNLFHMTPIMAVLMIIVLTMGEILSMPFMNTYWISRSADHNRGQYAGLYTIAWSIAQTAGPLLGAQMAEYAGFSGLWWVAGGLCFAVAIGFWVLDRGNKKDTVYSLQHNKE